MAHDQVVRNSLRLAKDIEPMLHGRGPDVQGAALCELVSIWLAGHAPDIREAVLAHWLESLRELTKVNSKMLGMWEDDADGSTD